MRISINGVELVLPDDQPVHIDGGVVSVGSASGAAPLQLEHAPQGAPVKAFVEKRGGARPGAGRPGKTLQTTEQVKDAMIKLIRQMRRPVTTRTFSMKLPLDKTLSEWRKKRYIDVVLHEMLDAGVVIHGTDGRNHWWGLPGMEGQMPGSRQLPVADDDVAA